VKDFVQKGIHMRRTRQDLDVAPTEGLKAMMNIG